MRRDKAVKYFQLAQYQAELFSKDPHTKVGCSFLAPESLQILSMGFNGFPRGIDETIKARWERPTKYAYVVHAEENGICNACRRGTPLEGSIAVATKYPCSACARSLIQVGISTLITVAPDFASARWGEESRVSVEMFAEAGVKLIFINESELAQASTTANDTR